MIELRVELPELSRATFNLRDVREIAASMNQNSVPFTVPVQENLTEAVFHLEEMIDAIGIRLSHPEVRMTITDLTPSSAPEARHKGDQ